MANIKPITDKDIQLIVGNLLRAGVLLSMGIVLIGGCVYLLWHGKELADYSVFDSNKVTLKSIPAISASVTTFKGPSIIQFGLLLLIFTPIARVIMSVISFFIEKDYLYVIIGLIVLAVIMLSLSGGFAH